MVLCEYCGKGRGEYYFSLPEMKQVMLLCPSCYMQAITEVTAELAIDLPYIAPLEEFKPEPIVEVTLWEAWPEELRDELFELLKMTPEETVELFKKRPLSKEGKRIVNNFKRRGKRILKDLENES